MARKPRKKPEGETSTALIVSDRLADSEKPDDVLRELGHSPFADLVRVASTGHGKLPNEIVAHGVETCRKIAKMFLGSQPSYSEQFRRLADWMDANLVYRAKQQEINDINLALLKYQMASFKAVDPPATAPEKGEGTFEHALTVAGAKLAN